MKCTIPEISWHNRDPVLSVDIQALQADHVYRLATGGTDHHVVIWQLNILENGGVSVEMLSDLTRHTRAVNAVRFSPDGLILASSDDDAAIILWKRGNNDSSDIFLDENEKDNKEHWSIFKILRNHIEDVHDLCWSSCSQFLISGSVDNTAIVWDIQKGKGKAILSDHKGFVQGVAYDPKGQLAATLSSDRYLRIFNITTDKAKLSHRVHKTLLPHANPENINEEDTQKTSRLFYDDTLKSFCRRLSFSPDGKLLVAPSGILEDTEGNFINVTHVFLRSCLSRPVLCLPTHDKHTIAVRFCPQMFELRNLNIEDPETPCYTEMFNLPYRLVFAVATQNAVLIYDTQQPIPFAKVSNNHYTRLSDVSWSSDGRILVVSSTDGYCSLVSFGEEEIGTVYSPKNESLVLEKASPPPECLEVKQISADQSNVGNSDKANEELCLKDKEMVAKPIAVKRKPGKRIELKTISSNIGKSSTTSTGIEDKVSEDTISTEPSVVKCLEESKPVQKSPEESKPVKKSPEESKPVQKSPEESKPVEKSPEESKILAEESEESNPKSAIKQISATKRMATDSKTPRRVSLITLSSTKSNKIEKKLI